jgi:hypothetical protein
MVDWDSHNPSPPSLLFPPDGNKWYVRTEFPRLHIVVAPNGRTVCIAELRGWLRSVGTGCNEGDPDWHYTIELDPAWIDGLGISLEALLRPGDVINNLADGGGVASEIKQRTSSRALYLQPMIHMELDGWQRTDKDRGNPPLPASWTFKNECNGGATVWPFNPRNPKAGDPPLAAGQYVRVVGSLVTDEPHLSRNWFATNTVLQYGQSGYDQIKQWFGQETADLGQTNAIKVMWGGTTESDPNHPARWNEIHSPDYIGVLASPDLRETVRCIAVVAKNGPTAGDTEGITVEIPVPPGRPTRWHAVGYGRLLGPSTVMITVKTEQVTLLPDGVRVHVEVQGQGGLGSHGKYFGIYRVGWRGIRPQLRAAASSNGMSVVSAADADGKTVVRLGIAAAPYWPAAWIQVQSGIASPGAAIGVVSRAPSCFDAFVAAPNGTVCTAATQGGAWGGWWTIPGVTSIPGGPISAVSRSLNKLDIFLADNQGRVMSAAWEPGFTKWAGWWQIRGGLTAPGGEVRGVSRSTDLLDIFMVGTDGQVYTAAWAPGPNGWQGRWSIPGIRATPGWPVTCVSRAPNTLDIFVTDPQGRVMWSRWEPGFAQWQGWAQVQGGSATPGAAIAAVSRRPGFLDIFAVGSSGAVYTAAWAPGAGWRGWWSIPGVQCDPGTPLVALSPAQDVLLVMTSASSGNLVGASWTPTSGGWSAWSQLS